jgi:radical SAM superfamily enzyme YgiQ (UPF0313 family)
MASMAPLTTNMAAVARAVPQATPLPFVTFIRGPIVSTPGSMNNEATPSIAFAYISSYIAKQGYPFSIVDGIGAGLNQVWPIREFPAHQIQGLPLEKIIELIPADSDVLAFSGMFSGDWPMLRLLIQRARARFPDALIVAGGEHITALTEYCLRDCPELDVCVRGEGEQIFYELLESWRTQRDYSDVAGIGFLDDDQYIQNGFLPRIRDIDNIPWPQWPEGYLEKFWEAGKSYGTQTERDMPVMASRGCPYQCTFCSNAAMWTTRYILRDQDDLINEIKAYKKLYGITSLQFYDLTAVTKRRWTIEFCEKLIAAGINLKWSLPSGTRSEALDQETLTLLKKTGCDYLVYAPESGSPETLMKIKKRVNLDRLTESVIAACKLGIVCRTNLIIGFPHETRKNVWETILFGLKLAVKGVDEVSIYIFSPYPGTEIFEELVKSKRLKIDDQYFLALTSLNGNYFETSPLVVNPHMGGFELAFYRVFFMMANYAIGYLLHPSRILRTLRNLTSKTQAATVFEHRLKDALKRRKSAVSRVAERP